MSEPEQQTGDVDPASPKPAAPLRRLARLERCPNCHIDQATSNRIERGVREFGWEVIERGPKCGHVTLYRSRGMGPP